MNPDCRDGKHASCSGGGWDYRHDEPMPCPCDCHEPTKAKEPDHGPRPRQGELVPGNEPHARLQLPGMAVQPTASEAH